MVLRWSDAETREIRECDYRIFSSAASGPWSHRPETVVELRAFDDRRWLRRPADERIRLPRVFQRLTSRSPDTLLMRLDPGGEVRRVVSVYARFEVRVEPNRCVDLGMPELRLDIIHGLPLAEHQGGVRVARIVDAKTPKLGFLEDPGPDLCVEPRHVERAVIGVRQRRTAPGRGPVASHRRFGRADRFEFTPPTDEGLPDTVDPRWPKK